MKLENLPQDLIEQLWERGLAGKLIYVPKQKSETLVAKHTPGVLMEVEASYEERGVTYYWESAPRKGFSLVFGTRSIVSKLRLKPRTATRVVSAAYKAWREWFGHHERLKLEQLRDLAEGAGIEYSALYFTYLGIRNKLRRGEKADVDVDEAAGYHGVQVYVMQPVLDLAKASVASCPWRTSP